MSCNVVSYSGIVNVFLLSDRLNQCGRAMYPPYVLTLEMSTGGDETAMNSF
jgi:hypothetical protein